MARVELFNQVVVAGSNRQHDLSKALIKNHKAESKNRVLIVSPHPDDMELFLGHVVQYLLANGFEIYELLMSWGEMGLRRYRDLIVSLETSQKCLKAVRLGENIASKKIYNEYIVRKQPNTQLYQIEIIPMNFPDGEIQNSNLVQTKIQKILRKLHPQMVIAPDYQYPVDFHPDHLISGRILHTVLQSLRNGNGKPPDLYFYQTFKPNFNRFPMQSWRVWTRALECHNSQFSGFGACVLKLVSFAYYILFGQGYIPMRAANTPNGHRIGKGNQFISWLHRLFFHIVKFTTKPTKSMKIESNKR